MKYSFLLFFFTFRIFAASCCGGGANFPGLITGDYKSQFVSSINHSSIIGHTNSNKESIFHSKDNNERSQTLKLTGTMQVSDLWQAGLSLPIVRKSFNRPGNTNTHSGLGDIELHGAYEFLPEYSYSSWRPRGFLFVSATLPTAPSINDPDVILEVERARGQGFMVLKSGFSFFKVLGNWDFQLLGQLEKPFARTFQTKGSSIQKHPGLGWSALASFGHSPFGGDFRWGMAFAPSSKAAVRNSENTLLSDSQFVWDTTLSLSYLVNFDWSVNFNYTDQTILGPSKNATLSRSSALSIMKKWTL